jgi:hypothetical protein
MIFAALPSMRARQAALFPLWAGDLSSVRAKIVASGMIAVLSAPGLVYSLYAGFCFWPEGISARDNYFSEGRLYSWRDVRSLSVGCPGRSVSGKAHITSYGGTEIRLFMRDLTVIWLYPGPSPKHIWDAMAKSMCGSNVIYNFADTSDCKPDDQILLYSTAKTDCRR